MTQEIIAAAVVHPATGFPEPLQLMPGRARSRSFWDRVVVNGADDCWTWTGALNDGYGRPMYRGRSEYAHRIAYELLVGPIPMRLGDRPSVP